MDKSEFNKNIYSLLTLWSSVLKPNVQEECEKIDNLIFEKNPSLKSVKKVYKEIDIIEIKDSSINENCGESDEVQEVKETKSKLTDSLDELFEFSSEDDLKDENQKNHETNFQNPPLEELTSIDTEIDDDIHLGEVETNKLIEILNLLKDGFKEEDHDNLLVLITNLHTKHKLNDQELRVFAKNILNIEEYEGNLITSQSANTKVTLKENQLCMFFDTLLTLNETGDENLSNYAAKYFRYIFTNYLGKRIDLELTSSNSSASMILTRKVVALCCNLSKAFPNQFALSFFIILLFKINSKQNADKLMQTKQKLLVEFLIKLLRDLFDEDVCVTILEHLLNEYVKYKWTEHVYQAISTLNEKVFALNQELIKYLIEKMYLDSNALCSNIIFSKLLVSILNKNKNYSYNILNMDKTSLEKVRLIAETNQTILKKSLLNMVYSVE